MFKEWRFDRQDIHAVRILLEEGVARSNAATSDGPHAKDGAHWEFCDIFRPDHILFKSQRVSRLLPRAAAQLPRLHSDGDRGGDPGLQQPL